MTTGQIVLLRNGNLGKIVAESRFGKLLIIEDNGDELPPTHWHNSDGSFHTDAESELDVVKDYQGCRY